MKKPDRMYWHACMSVKFLTYKRINAIEINMKIGNIDLGEQVLLAPMEDVTDIAFRLMCKRLEQIWSILNLYQAML